jgi:hypothetical protein
MGLGASPALAIKCDAPRIAERGGLGRLTQVSVLINREGTLYGL